MPVGQRGWRRWLWSRHSPRMSLGRHARRQRLGSAVSLLGSRVSRPAAGHHTAASHQNPADLPCTLLRTAHYCAPRNYCAPRSAHCAHCALRTAHCALRTALCTAQARQRTPTTASSTSPLHNRYITVTGTAENPNNRVINIPLISSKPAPR